MLKIDKETSKKTILRLHKALWLWVQKFPEKDKYEWPGWGGREFACNDCFLCEYAISHDLPCDKCLVDWETESGHCNSRGSFYREYLKVKDLSRKAYYAGKIANLKMQKED